MSKHYIHIWKDYNDDTISTQEAIPSESVEDAVDAYWKQYQSPYNYLHTLVLNINGGTYETMDITDYIDIDTLAYTPKREKLTGHEMGLINGAI